MTFVILDLPSRHSFFFSLSSEAAMADNKSDSGRQICHVGRSISIVVRFRRPEHPILRFPFFSVQ